MEEVINAAGRIELIKRDGLAHEVGRQDLAVGWAIRAKGGGGERRLPEHVCQAP
ncbi:hypothetical protein VA596_26090 [Amycolatopsis sp., V23-08]|uniref:Uncharacterized protein n=1 Tax=Amycolatopsis heterodermiae TaxID=3110235 RepID=A0ABU5R9W7_9PSEU|nr:hypothetical protein [Amycolatopsis sp., V23-08]MEA5363028.1 hypothetical protein [Amycolatopsis sp., V23-08]